MLENPAEAQKFLDEVALAARWSLSARTLQGWRVTGEGPRFLKAGSGIRAAVRYALPEVERFEAAHTIGSTAERKRTVPAKLNPISTVAKSKNGRRA
jgi:hypothetical protein